MRRKRSVRHAHRLSPSRAWSVAAFAVIALAMLSASSAFIFLRMAPTTDLRAWGALLAPSGWMFAALLWWALEAASLVYGRPLNKEVVRRGLVARAPLAICGVAVLLYLSMISSADVSAFVRGSSSAIWIRAAFAAYLYIGGACAFGLVLHYPSLRRLKRDPTPASAEGAGN